MTEELTSTPITTPHPDPTVLTDRAVERAIVRMHEYVDSQLAIRDERIKGIDLATTIRNQAISNVPAMVDEKVLSHNSVVDVRFEALELRFKAIEHCFAASDAALTTALASAKELAVQQEAANTKAIDKAERATAETIKANYQVWAASHEALAKSVDALTGSVNRMEAMRLGAKDDRSGLYAGIAALASIGSIVLFTIAIAAVLGANGA